MITSNANPQVRFAVRLRESRARRSEGLFLIDGRREIERAAHCGIELVQLIIDAEHVDRSELTAFAEDMRASMLPVSRKLMEKIAFGDRNEGIVAVARTPERTLDNLDAACRSNENLLLGVVEGVEKPGNLGAIFRTADGAGFDGLIVADPTCEPFNPQVLRASLGTVFHVPFAVASSRETFDWLIARKINIAAARCDEATPYTDFDFAQPTAIVLGTEANGLTDLWCPPHVRPVHVPMDGIADSLNVAATAAVLFYHARFTRGAEVPAK